MKTNKIKKIIAILEFVNQTNTILSFPTPLLHFFSLILTNMVHKNKYHNILSLICRVSSSFRIKQNTTQVTECYSYPIISPPRIQHVIFYVIGIITIVSIFSQLDELLYFVINKKLCNVYRRVDLVELVELLVVYESRIIVIIPFLENLTNHFSFHMQPLYFFLQSVSVHM